MIEPYPDEMALNPNDVRFHDDVRKMLDNPVVEKFLEETFQNLDRLQFSQTVAKLIETRLKQKTITTLSDVDSTQLLEGGIPVGYGWMISSAKRKPRPELLLIENP